MKIGIDYYRYILLSAAIRTFTPPTRKYSWYSFLLQAESNPGPQCGRKDYVDEKFGPVQFLNQMRNRVTFFILTKSLILLELDDGTLGHS